MAKNKKNIERRKKWPPQVLTLAIATSAAQFFGMWYIFLVMTPETNEFRWTPLLLQFILNFCFTFLLISMCFRTFHLNRIANSIHQTLQEERRKLKIKEAYFRHCQQQSEAENKAKSLFLASVSHELRTPMNSILGFADILKEEELTEEQHEYIEMIALGSQNLLTLVNDILDFSKIEAGKVEISPINYSLDELCKYIESIMKSLAGEKGIDYAIIKSGNLPSYFMADPVRVCQCLTNLISNAIKFTEEGYVHLEIHRDEHDGQMYLRFDVKDTGIGLSEEQCTRIFEVFSQADESTTRKYGGTGLGLPISRKLAILMGGSIEVKSQVGIGSVFTFELPLITQPPNSGVSETADSSRFFRPL